jgi:hypothetical protein
MGMMTGAFAQKLLIKQKLTPFPKVYKQNMDPAKNIFPSVQARLLHQRTDYFEFTIAV